MSPLRSALTWNVLSVSKADKNITVILLWSSAENCQPVNWYVCFKVSKSWHPPGKYFLLFLFFLSSGTCLLGEVYFFRWASALPLEVLHLSCFDPVYCKETSEGSPWSHMFPSRLKPRWTFFSPVHLLLLWEDSSLSIASFENRHTRRAQDSVLIHVLQNAWANEQMLQRKWNNLPIVGMYCFKWVTCKTWSPFQDNCKSSLVLLIDKTTLTLWKTKRSEKKRRNVTSSGAFAWLDRVTDYVDADDVDTSNR